MGLIFSQGGCDRLLASPQYPPLVQMFELCLGKMILSQFPYPMTVTMVQLASIALWSMPMLKVGTRRSNNEAHFKLISLLSRAKIITNPNSVDPRRAAMVGGV